MSLRIKGSVGRKEPERLLTEVKQALSCFGYQRHIWAQPKDSEHDIVESCGEDGRVPLEVQTPPAIIVGMML